MSAANDFRDCLLTMDVARARSIWAAIAPHLPQPADAREAERLMHMARVESRSMPAAAIEYSRAWLAERYPATTALAVGIAVGLHTNAGWQRRRDLDVRNEMSEAVLLSVRDGLDLDGDAVEVKRRMMAYRERAHRHFYGIP